MMTTEQLLHYIENPEELDVHSLQELDLLIREYPYFQTARILYLRNLAQLRSLRFGTELNRNAAYCTDRRRLFLYLGNEEFAWSNLMRLHEQNKRTQPDVSFELIDSFLTSSGEDSFPEELEDLVPLAQTESPDYVASLLEQPDAEVQNVSSSKELEKQQLIDSFIEKGEKSPVFIPPAEALPEPPKGVTKEDSLLKDESFLTESLAKIYIKQKKYAKALEIIKKLSLKYPEKNVYFADQIRFLEKIITNIKTE